MRLNAKLKMIKKKLIEKQDMIERLKARIDEFDNAIRRLEQTYQAMDSEVGDVVYELQQRRGADWQRLWNAYEGLKEGIEALWEKLLEFKLAVGNAEDTLRGK